MKWWEGIWLNEAFASFMEMKATDAHRPEWKRWVAFGAVERPWAMEVDHLSTTRPVEFEVTSPEDADQMFDALTYGKGSSVLRMIEQFIGEEAFRNGVGAYLRRHAYGNTVTADLWAGLDGASQWPVGAIMDTWILQGGYPQIDVRPDRGRLVFRQQRFLAIPDETDQTQWKVPLQIRGVAGGEPFEMSILLEDETHSVDAPADLEWVTANAGGSGFYRVRYAGDLHQALVDHLAALDATERYAFLYDAFAFAQVGQTEMPSVLDLISHFRHEGEQAIWQLIFRILGAVHHHLVADDDLDAFAAWVRSVVGPLVERLGREARPDDTDLTRRLRGQAIAAFGALGNDPQTVEWAAATTEAYLEGRHISDPELATAALAVTAAHGDADTHSRYLKRYMDASDPQEQLRFLRALTGFDDPEMAAEVVAATLDGRIRNQDGAVVQCWLMGNREAGPQTWSEIRRCWEEAVATFPPMTFRRLVEGLPALSRPEVAADVKASFAETAVPDYSKAVAQNLELLDVNVAARRRETDRVGAWLRSRPETV